MFGTTSTPGPGGGLDRVLAGDGDDAPAFVAHGEVPSPLTLDSHQAGVTQVDHVPDQKSVGLGDAQTHDPLQPEHHLVDHMEMGGDSGALGQGERALLVHMVARASGGVVGERSLQPFGGVEPGGNRALARAKANTRRRIHRASET